MRKLLLLFVSFLFLLQGKVQSQVQLSVELQSDSITYLVKLRPDVSYDAPLNTTNNAQITFVVPSGGFVPGPVMSINGLWSEASSIPMPQENPTMDYIMFNLQSGTSAISYITGEEVELFSFQNIGTCTGEVAFVLEDDPFFPPNSESVNIGNQISVLGAGFINAFTGIFGASANCLEITPSISVGGENPTDSLPAITIDSVRLTPPSRCGEADGSIAIFANHQDGNALQYSVDGGTTWTNDSIVTGLQAGTYTVRVRDILVLDFADHGMVTLETPPIATLQNIEALTPTCEDSTGRIIIEATNIFNTAPLQFSIDGGTTYQDSSGIFENLAAGIYELAIRIAGVDCIDEPDPILLVANPCPEEGEETGGTNPTPTMPAPTMPTPTIGEENGGNNTGQNEEEEEEEEGVGEFIDSVGFAFTDATTCPFALILNAENGVFTISLLSDTTFTFPNNITSTAQIVLKVPTGGFEIDSLTNLIQGVIFSDNSRSDAPPEAPEFDYISFGLDTRGTQAITYEQGNKLALFSFRNNGACTGGPVSLIDNNTDPFVDNSSNVNVNQQITVSGTGSDAEICVSNLDITDCGIERNSMMPMDTTGGMMPIDTTVVPMPMDTTGGMPVDTTQGPAPVDSTLTSCPNVTLGADRTICEGDSIQLNAIAGQGTFSWITTGNISCTDCQQPTIRPLESTMYIVNSTTLAGCTTSDTIFITVSEVPLIDTILQVVPTACQTDGSITIQIADNTSTFQYSIDNGASFQPTSSFNNLGGGIYPVQVRNASNCTLPTARTITLEDNSPIRVDSVLVSNPNDCQNELGNIMAMVTLQDSVMAQYSVDSGATWVNRANFDSLDAGTYHLLVRTVDSSCVINYQNNPIQLIRPDTARIISGLADRSFCEEDTKSIRVILNQAIDGFTIEGGQFMNADTEGDTLTFEPVFAGATATYAVMLTGNSGCSTIDSFQIAVISCADIEACGFFNGLDTLRAEFTDSIAEVCVPISNMDIEEFQFIQDREIVDITFGQCNDASIFYSFNTASLGTPPFLLQEWIVNGDTLTDFEFNTSEELVNRMNEFDQEANWVITDNSGFIGIASENTYGPLQLLHIGSNTTLELQLNNMNIFFQSLQLTGIGTQVMIVRDTMVNCQDTLIIKINGTIADTINMDSTSMPLPFMDTLRLTTLMNTTLQDQCVALGDMSADSVTIGECSEVNNGFLLLQDEPCFNYIPNNNFIGQDSFCLTLCTPSNCDTAFVIITVSDGELPSNDTTLIPVMDTINLQTTINTALLNQCLTDSSTIIDSITWIECQSPENGMASYQDNYCFNYTPNLNFVGVDSLCVAFCTPTACDSTLIFINVTPQSDSLIVHNGFSPNSDDINKFFVIENIEKFPNNELQVFNRWGNLVYQKKNYKNDWDGTFETTILPDGIYFYLITLPSENNNRHRSGYIVLRR